ncbi:hypothetical protein [Micromonospora sp. RTGN7]|uniref:hypothetical protein n=1 Tax=Micromonospora sp. RTGN7 TaxID=3016526 RepID=UPI0029FF4711|nr:hypothetical protein [Micromonospora sp. RTGN7]
MTRDELLAELLLERYGPRPLPPPAPPRRVPQAPAVPAPPPRGRHLVLLDGGQHTTTAA